MTSHSNNLLEICILKNISYICKELFMKSGKIFTATLILFLGLSSISVAQRYEMVWSDEFEGTELDTDTWTEWRGSAFNNEWQFYTPRDTNIYVEDGLLHLVGLRENFGGRNWTSGRINSRRGANFLYGKVEIRAKLPAGRGLWPAFWMMPTESEYGGWPYSGEMDIMEYRGHQTNRTQGTIHFSRLEYPGSGNAVADREYISGEYELPEGSFAEEFHIYSFEWTDSTLKWFVDDLHYFTIRREEVEDRAEIYPFNKQFYVILNLAIGGDYLGDMQPDASTPDRNEVLVDYVRVYQDQNKGPDIDLPFADTVPVPAREPIELRADITDPDGDAIREVEFFMDDELIVADTTAPYSANWEPKVDGCYQFKVKATDVFNGTTETAPITFEAGSGCEVRPFNETPHSFPGTLEFEEYNYGGFDRSYFDRTPYENEGGAFRTTEGVDIIVDPNDENNYLISDIDFGEWTRYTLDVTESGLYDLELRVVGDGGSGRLDLKLDNEELTFFTRINDGSTPYVYDLMEGVEIEAGTYILEAEMLRGGIMLDRLTATLISTSSDEDPDLPSEIDLRQNYPNPFNPSTQISFTLPAAQNVQLAVFNSLGQQLEILHTGVLQAGEHTFTFNASELSSGIYLTRLYVANGTVITRKMMLIK